MHGPLLFCEPLRPHLPLKSFYPSDVSDPMVTSPWGHLRCVPVSISKVNFLLYYSHLCPLVDWKPLLGQRCILFVFTQCLKILAILNVYSVPGSGLSTLHALPHLILTITLKSPSRWWGSGGTEANTCGWRSQSWDHPCGFVAHYCTQGG